MATLTSRGKSWALNWTNPKTGQRERRIIGDKATVTQSDAQLALQALEYELASGNPVLNLVPRTEHSVRFSELADRYLDWRRAQ